MALTEVTIMWIYLEQEQEFFLVAAGVPVMRIYSK